MNRKIIITVLWIIFIVTSINFIFFNPERSIEKYALNVLVVSMYTLVITLGNGVLNELLNRRYSWVHQTKLRTIVGIILTILVNVILVLACNYVNFIVIQKQNFTQFFTGSMGMNNWITLNVSLLISAIMHAKGFMEEWKKSARKEVVEQKLIARSATAQFDSLKNQLDPHFLFNSLNVLSALIDENPDQAQHFTASMSKIYRYVLEQKDKELVTVAEEIDFAKTYCELLKTRFEDSVQFKFDVIPADLDLYVVPLSLQLLLENSIKHNFATSQRPLKVKVYTADSFLLIENNLQAREQVKESAGIGLSNIVQRYSLLTKQNVFIEKSSDFFRVKIPLLTQKTSIMTTNTNPESIAYNRAAKRVKELKGFYGNLISYALVIPFLIFVNLYTVPQYQWFWWPMLGWGIGLASHAFQVFGISNNWEEKQIQKILAKEKEVK